MPSSSGRWESKRCGQPLRGARVGEFCTKWAVRGGTRCSTHGNTKSERAKAKNVVRIGEAQRRVDMYGLPVEISPVDALIQELHRTQGHVAWLAEKVRAIANEKDMIWEVAEQTSRAGGTPEGTFDETKYSSAENGWIRMYTRERTHLVHVANTISKLGIAEAYVRVAAQQAAMFEGALIKILDGAGIDKSDPAIRSLVASTMRALSESSVILDIKDDITGGGPIIRHDSPAAVARRATIAGEQAAKKQAGIAEEQAAKKRVAE